jgi:glutaredoxin
MAKRIVLFTLPHCPVCRAERNWLTDRNIEFDEYDLEDPAVQEEMRNLEKRVKRRLEHTPITVINGQVYEGFDPSAFEQLLAEED